MQNGGAKTESTSRRERVGRTLIFVNPHSGRGLSTKIFQQQLLPLLKSRQIDHQLVVSDQQASITKHIQNLSSNDLKQIKSIIVVSGDGALHEVINAIMHHKDWRQALEIPLGIIPTGSGNGLAYTLIREKHPDLTSRSEAVRICCEAALQSEMCKTDLVKLSFGENSTVYSFLSIGWGLLSDIDIDSEWLRKFGEFRFTVYGLLRSVTARAYSGRLSYKVATNHSNELLGESNSTSKMYSNSNNQENSPREAQNQTDEWIHIEDNFSCLYAVYQSYVSSVTKFAPKSTRTDRLIYLTYIRGKLSPCMAVKFLLRIKDGSHDTLPYVVVVPVTSFKFQPLERSKVVVDGEVISWDQTLGPLTAEIATEPIKLLWS